MTHVSPHYRRALGSVDVAISLTSLTQYLTRPTKITNLDSLKGCCDVWVELRVTEESTSYDDYIVLSVAGFPRDTATKLDVLVEGTFTRHMRDKVNPAFMVAEAQPVAVLRGNGRLATFPSSWASRSNVEVRGVVTVYSPPLTPAKSLAAAGLGALRDDGVLCDVVLRVGGRGGAEFRAHRVVLVAQSPVFRAQLAGGFKEATASVVDVGATGCTATVFAQFLDYLYTGVLPRDFAGRYGDLVGVLELARFYMMDELKQVCCERLLDVRAENVLDVLGAVVVRLAEEGDAADVDTQGIPEDVLVNAVDVALQHWEVVVGSPQWAVWQASHPVAAVFLKGAVVREKRREQQHCKRHCK